jgi:hypothetical protein
MSYGMNVYQQSGGLTYSSADVTWNQVGFFLLSPDSSGSQDFGSIIAGREVLITQMFVDPPPSNERAYAFDVSISGTTISWSGGNQYVYALVLMR